MGGEGETMAMDAAIDGADSLERVSEAEAAQPWPSSPMAWYAVVVLALMVMLGFMESQILNYLIKPIKRDFGLSDLEMSVLMGIAPTILYAALGFPLARLIDRLQRKAVLGAALGIAGIMTTLAGFTQNFWQFAVCRVMSDGYRAVSNPGAYSIMSDYFPRQKLPRAIAGLTFGLVMGRALAPVYAGTVVGLATAWGSWHLGGLLIRDWQTVYLMSGTLGFTACMLILTVREPPRRGLMRQVGSSGRSAHKALPMSAVFTYIWANKRLFLPQFISLAFFSVESFGLESWRMEFLRRTYGWEPQVAGPVLGTAMLFAQASGLIFGTRFAEWMGTRTDDANLRSAAILYTILPVFAVASPLMPTPYLSIACSAITGMLGVACAAPQNAALQSITPNEMRGQMTALYYFVIQAIGMGIGPTVMAFVTDVIIGDENQIRYAMAGSAAVVTPLAAIAMWFAVRPYGRAIAEVKAREAI
jgi:MFS family permease